MIIAHPLVSEPVFHGERLSWCSGNGCLNLATHRVVFALRRRGGVLSDLSNLTATEVAAWAIKTTALVCAEHLEELRRANGEAA